MWDAPAFRHAPRPFIALRQARSASRPRAQFARPSAWTPPVPPQQTSQSSSQPAIEFLQHSFGLGQPEVIDPAPKRRRESLDGAPQRLPAPAAQQFAYSVLQPLNALRRDPQPALAMRSEAIPQELFACSP